MRNNISIDNKLISDLSRLAKLKFDKYSAIKIKEDLGWKATTNTSLIIKKIITYKLSNRS